MFFYLKNGKKKKTKISQISIYRPNFNLELAKNTDSKQGGNKNKKLNEKEKISKIENQIDNKLNGSK